jgi:hypothetical protein
LKAIAILLLLASTGFGQDSAKDETQVWQLEKAYWEYVKANHLERYRALWHQNFLGWPFISSNPVRKDHITDWITANIAKGIKLRSYAQLGIQGTGDVAVNYYRINARWTNSQDAAIRTDKLRVTHTWIRMRGTWPIIGGMSSAVNAEGK